MNNILKSLIAALPVLALQSCDENASKPVEERDYDYRLQIDPSSNILDDPYPNERVFVQCAVPPPIYCDDDRSKICGYEDTGCTDGLQSNDDIDPTARDRPCGVKLGARYQPFISDDRSYRELFECRDKEGFTSSYYFRFEYATLLNDNGKYCDAAYWLDQGMGHLSESVNDNNRYNATQGFAHRRIAAKELLEDTDFLAGYSCSIRNRFNKIYNDYKNKCESDVQYKYVEEIYEQLQKTDPADDRSTRLKLQCRY